MPDQVERLSGCQKPDACEWGWWPDHCQCPSSEGSRCAAPEPVEMVDRNQRSAANERNRSEKALQERLKFAADVVGRLEAERDQARKQRDEELRERLEEGRIVDAVATALSGGKGPTSYRPTAEIALRALRDSIFEEADRG